MASGIYKRTTAIREKNRIATKKYHEANPNPFKGKRHSDETKAKIAKTKKGRKASADTKQNISEALKGNKNRLGKAHSLETRKRIGISRRGKNHPNWKGGTGGSFKRNRVEYIEWRKAVFSKSGNTCGICEKDNVRLVAHHIKPVKKYPELMHDAENGIVLCRSCHHAIHLIGALFENGVNSGKLLLIKQLICLVE